jgi:hypothetical protein
VADDSKGRRVSGAATTILVVGVVVLALLLATLVPFRNFLDDLFNRDTYTATGDVVLKRLQDSQKLEVAKGTFDVPVVVCNGRATAHEQFGGDADELLNTCDGLGDEKATVIIRSDVSSVIDLDDIKPGDVEIDGKEITIRVPRPRLDDPKVDAEKGVMIVGIESSPLPGKLPDDYIARAAKSAKGAVSSVADESGLNERGEESTRSILEGLLKSFGFTDVTIEFKRPPSP